MTARILGSLDRIVDRGPRARPAHTGARPTLAIALAVLLHFAPPSELAAQAAPGLRGLDQSFADGENERYLRALQSLGSVERYPWSVRAFSLNELARLAPADGGGLPWSGREETPSAANGELEYAILAPRIRFSHNSAFPYGVNDGPVWRGKGLTTELTGGIAARYGPLSLVLAPVLFRAENSSFTLAPNGLGEEDRFAYFIGVRGVDFPQRFGDDAYARLDPGQSTVRLDLGGAAAGFSTANQIWGPSSRHALILGNNAPGFPHLFAGTSRPVGIGIGELHARVVWGKLSDSGYAVDPQEDDGRLFSGYVITFLPRGLTGLELGATRVFHTVLPGGEVGLDDLRTPFGGLLKKAVRDDGTVPLENQLAGVFARWVFSPSGLEMYGEYAREDHNWDLRDFLLEPDQQRAYTLGLSKSWRRGSSGLVVVRGEVVNSQISNIDQVRGQDPFYVHGRVRQGHTHRGQVLGSPAVLTGGGSLLAGDYYHDKGRWTARWSRVTGDWGQDTLAQEPDVSQAVGVEMLRFRDDFDITAGVDAVFHLNRYLRRDEFNLSTTLGARWRF